MMLAIACALAAVLGCCWLLVDAVRDRRWSDGVGWLLAGLVFAAFIAAFAWLDHETQVSECQRDLATENARRMIDRQPLLSDTCTADPDQFDPE